MEFTKKHPILIPFCLLIICFVLFLTSRNNAFQNKILPNVYIDSISMSGLSKKEAIARLNKLYKNSTSFKIQFEIDTEKVSTLSSNEINYRLPIKDLVEHAYLIGRGDAWLSAWYQIAALHLGVQEYTFTLTPSFNSNYVKEKLDSLNKGYMVPAQNARFEFKNNRVTAFQVSKDGFELEVNIALDWVKSEMLSMKKKHKNMVIIPLQKHVLKPNVQLSDINDLGILELVAEGTSHFAHSIPERVHNIQTGASRLNGVIIKPGETFSFVKEVGEISQATGFKPAFVISEGRTILGDGGGICQVSTTLFRAALRAGLPIVERNAHAYRVGYYEQDSKPGFDATIYSPSVDLKFTNNYSHSLLVQTNIDLDEMQLTFKLYGSPDNRQIEISDATVWNISSPPPTQYIDDFNLPIGVTRQIDFAAGGASAKFSYKVTKNNSVLFEKVFTSNFQPWKAIYLIGKKS